MQESGQPQGQVLPSLYLGEDIGPMTPKAAEVRWDSGQAGGPGSLSAILHPHASVLPQSSWQPKLGMWPEDSGPLSVKELKTYQE